MEKNFHHEIAPKDLAKTINLSVPRFYSIFKETLYRLMSICRFLNMHRPTTNWAAQPFDGCPKTFEWGDVLWSDNAYSDVFGAAFCFVNRSLLNKKNHIDSTMNPSLKL